jgi:hypothetical protein
VLVVIIDGVNEAAPSADVLNDLLELARGARRINSSGLGAIRIIASARLEYVLALEARGIVLQDSLFAHFATGFDASVPEHPVNHKAPFLLVRPFTELETAEAYENFQLSAADSCKAPWQLLPEPTKHLLAHPLFMRLFHRAFAGLEHPNPVSSAKLSASGVL